MDDIEVILYKAFHDFLNGLGVTENVYLGNSGFNAPAGPYTVWELISAQGVSWSASAVKPPEDVTGKEDYYTMYKGIADIAFLGSNAFSRALNVTNALREKTTCAPLKATGIGYSSHTPIRDASVAIDKESIQKGSSFQVSFYFVVWNEDRGEDAGVIEEATVLDDNSQIYTNWSPDSGVIEP